MKTIKEHKNAILRYHRSYIDSYSTIFELKQYMIELGICPRCGVPRWVGGRYDYTISCYNCGLKITDNEASKIEEGHKGILSKKLKMNIKQ